MRIVNNKIFIARGETPTYSARVIDKDTGAPFRITKEMVLNQDDSERAVVIEFVVRDSAYARAEDKRIRRHLILKKDVSYKLFDSSDIVEYNDLGLDVNEWIVPDDVDIINPGLLYHRRDSRGDNFYAYLATDETGSFWVDYDFDFNLTLTYNETSIMEPKTYKYEIALFTGNLKSTAEAGELPLEAVEYKKQLLGLTDFIVEGSISE